MNIPVSLRRMIVERANNRCEYCGMPESVSFAPHEIDHIIARKHGGQTISENLALSCILCYKHKGSDIASIDPETGQMVRLYHPRQDRWPDHFQLKAAYITSHTPAGRATSRLLQFNRSDRMQERQLLLQAGLFSMP